MNLLVLQDLLTRAEAKEIFSVEKNIVKDMKALIAFQQHSVTAAYLLTDAAELIPVEWAQQLWCQNKYINPAVIPNTPTHRHPKTGELCYTGREVFSACLPRGFFMKYGGVTIADSIFSPDSEQLNKSRLNDGIVYTIWKDFGGTAVIDFLSSTQLLLEAYIRVKGVSICADDCYVDISEDVKSKVRKSLDYVEQFHWHKPSDTGRAAEVVEDNICLLMDKCRDVVGDHVVEKLKARPGRNGLLDMVLSGSKGNLTNVVQSVGMIGQQRNHQSMRMDETSSHFNGNKKIARKHGMITRSFLRGMRPEECQYHLCGSRDGLVDTAVKTGEIGYCQRRIGKAMEDIIVNADKAVRNSHDNVIQFLYGDDGFDSVTVERNTLRMLTLSEEATMNYHRCYPEVDSPAMTYETQQRWSKQRPAYKWNTQVQRVLDLRYDLVASLMGNEFDGNCLCPVQFDRLIARAKAKSSFPLDVTPLDTERMVATLWEKLHSDHVLYRTMKVESLFWDRCSTSSLWKHARLDKAALTWFLEEIYHICLTKSITPNENGGLCAEQNSAQPLTQMALSRFHQSGQFSNLVSGIARIKEILNAIKNPEMPSLTIYPQDESKIEEIGLSLLQVLATDVINYWDDVIPDIGRDEQFKSIWTKWDGPRDTQRTLVIHMNQETAVRRHITPLMLANVLRKSALRKRVSDFQACFSYSSASSSNWWVSFSCFTTDTLWMTIEKLLNKKNHSKSVTDDMIQMYIYEKLVANCVVKGCRNIDDFYIDSVRETDIVNDVPTPVVRKVIRTKGTNLATLFHRKDIILEKTMSNFALETEKLLGIDAACACIEDELRSVMAINGAHVGSRHLQLLAQAMCFRGVVSPMTSQGICLQNTSVMKKAAFEKAADSFICGAVNGHKDVITTCTESIAWNAKLRCGTGNTTVYSNHAGPNGSPNGSPNVSQHLSHSLTAQQGKEYASRTARYNPPTDFTYLLQPKTKRTLTHTRSQPDPRGLAEAKTKNQATDASTAKSTTKATTKTTAKPAGLLNSSTKSAVRQPPFKKRTVLITDKPQRQKRKLTTKTKLPLEPPSKKVCFSLGEYFVPTSPKKTPSMTVAFHDDTSDCFTPSSPTAPKRQKI